MTDFREYVLAWLERRGWSQARLGEATEVSQSLVSKHLAEDERRRVTPSPENLAKYAPVLGISYEDLMRMCGYLPGEPAPRTADDIEDDVRARTAELLNLVRGAPPVFWATIIKATYDTAEGVARNMASALRTAEGARSSTKAARSSATTASQGDASGASARDQGRIKPRHQAVALAI